jgi:hypothetical protein
MRGFGQSFVVVCLATGALIQAQGSAPAQQAPAPPAAAATMTADQVLASAHSALGGAKLDAVKTFVVTGKTRRLQGNNLLPIEFEINCELPDKYVRKDEVPAQENDPTSRGFNADKLIQIPPPPPPPPPSAAGPPRAGEPPATAGASGRAGTPPPPGSPGAAGPGRMAGPPMPPPSPTTAVKQDFARLTLGMFAQSFSSYPLTFTYVGQAEAPQGKADVLDVKGAPNFAVRLFVNTTTHLPVMISWTQPPTPAQIVITAPGQPKPANPPPGAVIAEGPAVPAVTATQDDKDKYAKAIADLRKELMAKPIEYRIYYADYRSGESPMFPHRLRRATGSDTTEETTFDVFRINEKINPKKFEIVK